MKTIKLKQSRLLRTLCLALLECGMPATGPDAIDESDGHTTVFPIPADVRSLNNNLTQNAGY